VALAPLLRAVICRFKKKKGKIIKSSTEAVVIPSSGDKCPTICFNNYAIISFSSYYCSLLFWGMQYSGLCQGGEHKFRHWLNAVVLTVSCSWRGPLLRGIQAILIIIVCFGTNSRNVAIYSFSQKQPEASLAVRTTKLTLPTCESMLFCSSFRDLFYF